MNGSIVAIGLFDGVHLGHQAVIKTIVREAAEQGLASVVVTFDRHPSEILRPGGGPLLLTDPKTKRELISALGADDVVMVEFNKELAVLDPNQFLEKVINPLRPAKIVVGRDFRFGKNRIGDIAALEKFGRADGFAVEALALLKTDGIKISSSLVRDLISAGELDKAKELLGRYPGYRGIVAGGEKVGRTLGFPTANVEIDANICLPKDGVYAGLTTIGDDRIPSVINVGRAPTFGSRPKSLIEAHLLDFSRDIYGTEAIVEFRRRLRGEKKFKNGAELAEQIAHDAQKARDMVL
jgi:riboflavin kinase / FMN adenylyltransferase